MKIRTTRAETLSDGIIAIILTIMVLELKIPAIGELETDKQIVESLVKLLPYFAAYIISFITIGIYWLNHHHMFHLLKRTDEPLLFLNLFSLFWLSLIPITTALIGSHPTLTISSVGYGAVMFMTTLSFTFIRSHALKKGLIHTSEDKNSNKEIEQIFVKARRKSIIGTFIYLFSVPLAFWSVYFSYVCFIIPPALFFIPQGSKNDRLADEIEEKNE